MEKKNPNGLFEQFYQLVTHSKPVPFWKPKLLEAESFDLGSSFSSLGNMTSSFQSNVSGCVCMEPKGMATNGVTSQVQGNRWVNLEAADDKQCPTG